MVGPELGRETDATAESAYTMDEHAGHRLCVTTHACDITIRLARKWTSQTGGTASDPVST